MGEETRYPDWFAAGVVVAVVLELAVSFWALIALRSDACVTMQGTWSGDESWCASKPLAVSLLPVLTAFIGFRLFVRVRAEEQEFDSSSSGGVIMRLAGLALMVVVHAAILIAAI